MDFSSHGNMKSGATSVISTMDVAPFFKAWRVIMIHGRFIALVVGLTSSGLAFKEGLEHAPHRVNIPYRVIEL